MKAADFTGALRDPDAQVPEGIINPDGSAATKRFNVYRNNVASSLTEALEAAFPVVHKLVGDAFFRAMAGIYLRQHPPSTPLMMFYGEHMPAFLQSFPPAQSLPYLPDIAALELAMRHAYHGADARAIDPQVLVDLAPDALMAASLTLAPCVQILTSDYAIHGIYLANTLGSATAPVMQPESVLITRKEFDPQLHPLTAHEAACLTAIANGAPLSEAIAAGDESLDFGVLLGLLLAQGAIVKIN